MIGYTKMLMQWMEMIKVGTGIRKGLYLTQCPKVFQPITHATNEDDIVFMPIIQFWQEDEMFIPSMFFPTRLHPSQSV